MPLTSVPHPHPDADAGWTMILEPWRPWLDLRLGELWHARDLILLFVRRGFVATYKQTILGPLWYLIRPLLTAQTFTLIFHCSSETSRREFP